MTIPTSKLLVDKTKDKRKNKKQKKKRKDINSTT